MNSEAVPGAGAAPRPSRLLVAYYALLFVSTALSFGYPYPLFGVFLRGPWSAGAVVLDCLLLLHIVIGVWKAQRLTWYLLLGYNTFNLASLAVTLPGFGPEQLAELSGGADPQDSFYTWVTGAAVAMVLATLYAARSRSAFSNRNPYLF